MVSKYYILVVLVPTGSDNLVVIWNIDSGQPAIKIESHPDVIYSACWNWDGSKLLTTCKDKKLRIIDPRNGNIEEVYLKHSFIMYLFTFITLYMFKFFIRKLWAMRVLNPLGPFILRMG